MESLLEQTAREFDHLIKSQPDLVFIEEDLLKYDPKDAAGTVKRYQQEQEELEHLLQQTFEQLGTIKQELKQLEHDRRGTRGAP